MTGSGGGFGGGFDDSPISCETLVIETQLGSPKEEVIGRISEGDSLDVEIMVPENVVVCTFNGEVAGGVSSRDVSRLRECIENGTRYQARVLSKTEGQVRVKIEAIL